MKNTYHPISCDFHELLLAKATLKEDCTIVFIEDDNQVTVLSKIIDVYTKKKEEFMVLNSGQTIRLDHIISVNDETLPEISCTF